MAKSKANREPAKRLICRTIRFITVTVSFLAQRAPVHAGNTLLDYPLARHEITS